MNLAQTFADLRQANTQRLPLFKNKYGEPAHSQPDGSDWTDAEWLQAVIGELGEYANVRKKLQRGDYTLDEALPLLADELADVVCYLDERGGIVTTETKPMLIALTGPAHCGKSTVARRLIAGHDFVRVSFAEPLKRMLFTLGLTTAQLYGDKKNEPSALLCGKTPRHAMQTLGTQWGREMIGEDLWCNAAMLIVDGLLADGYSVVIDDCRFDNEASAIAERGGTLCALRRKGSGIEGSHESEQGVTHHYITAFVGNDDTVPGAALRVLEQATIESLRP